LDYCAEKGHSDESPSASVSQQDAGVAQQRVSGSGTLVRNVYRCVCEERLALAVERPSAIPSITKLPVS
jgi:hypothetical protein